MTKKILFLFVLGFLLMPVVVFAATCSSNPADNLPPCSGVGYVNDQFTVGQNNPAAGGPFQVSQLVQTTMTLINWLSWFIGVLAVVMGLYSGFLFITARDNANQLTTARNIMMYAIIGIGVAIIAFSLVSLSKSLLGFGS